MEGEYAMLDAVFGAVSFVIPASEDGMFKFFLMLLPARETEKGACSKKNTVFPRIEGDCALE